MAKIGHFPFKKVYMDVQERKRVAKILEFLEEATKTMPLPMTQLIIKDYGRDSFLILISCLLSLRARDAITYPVSKKLFEFAQTPQELVTLSRSKLEQILRPLGFYRRKAATLLAASRALLDHFDGKVPATEQELLLLPGVGRKTANLVLGEGFGIPALCVDTHVHRVSNRLGMVRTKSPEETEIILKKIIPQEKWIALNHYLVVWGQNVCVPISPFCSRCVLRPLCPRVGVTRSR